MAFFAPCRAEFACFRPWTGIGRPHEPTFLRLFFCYGASMNVGTLFSKYRHVWAWNNRAAGVWFPLPASPLGAAEEAKNLHHGTYRWCKSPSSLLFFCFGAHIGIVRLRWLNGRGLGQIEPAAIMQIPLFGASVLPAPELKIASMVTSDHWNRILFAGPFHLVFWWYIETACQVQALLGSK